MRTLAVTNTYLQDEQARRAILHQNAIESSAFEGVRLPVEMRSTRRNRREGKLETTAARQLHTPTDITEDSSGDLI